MKIDYMRLVHYVDCASNLAEGIAQDLKSKKGKISSGSVVHLGKFYAAARSVQELLELVEVDRSNIN